MKSNEQLKLQIELAGTVEEADKILGEEFADVGAKYAFLRGAYTFSVPFALDGCPNDAEKNYIPVLSTIVNSKWRA